MVIVNEFLVTKKYHFLKILIRTLILALANCLYLHCLLPSQLIKSQDYQGYFQGIFLGEHRPKIWRCCRNKTHFNLFYSKILVQV